MHQSLPALGVAAFSFAAIQAIVTGSNAVSPEADALSRVALTARKNYEQSQSLFGAKASAIAQIFKVQDEFQAGDPQRPTTIAVSQALAFIRALPDDLPLPEFSIEPDGAIAMDWIRSRARVISVSVGPSNRLAYAWLDGSDKGSSVVRFNGNTISPRLLNDIVSIVQDEPNAPIRAA